MNEPRLKSDALVICLHLSGTYDQLNSPCLASLEILARRIAQIVEAYSGEGDRVPWTIDPNLRASRTLKTSAVNLQV